MSLYKAIRDPRQFHRPLGVLNVGLAIIIAFYFSIGFFGYVQFGAAIAGTITVNLPAEPMYDAVQLLYAFAVLLTYPIILYVPIQVLWPIIRRKVARRLKVADSQKKADNSFSARAKLMTVEFAFRAALVLSTCEFVEIISFSIRNTEHLFSFARHPRSSHPQVRVDHLASWLSHQ